MPLPSDDILVWVSVCVCLRAGNVPAEYVRQLWDLLLKQTWDGAGTSSAGGCDGTSKLEQCCEKIEALGVKFYPNESRSVSWCCRHLQGTVVVRCMRQCLVANVLILAPDICCSCAA